MVESKTCGKCEINSRGETGGNTTKEPYYYVLESIKCINQEDYEQSQHNSTIISSILGENESDEVSLKFQEIAAFDR